MTNTLAIGLGALILGFLAIDFAVFEMANSLFLGRKFVDLIEWLAFWR